MASQGAKTQLPGRDGRKIADLKNKKRPVARPFSSFFYSPCRTGRRLEGNLGRFFQAVNWINRIALKDVAQRLPIAAGWATQG
jgi:hypothetical protein